MTEQSGLILVVDDNDSSRYLKMRVLRREGWRVEEAETGEQALDMVDCLPVDLVVLDIRLPGIDGFEVCRRIKERHPDVLVLHATATFVAARDRAAGLEGGADGYLAEPIEDAELIATVRALLRLRRSETALLAHQRDLSDFVENAPMGLCWLARDGTILWANRAQIEMLGYEKDQFVGRSIFEFDKDAEIREKFRGLLTTAAAFNGFEIDLRHQDDSFRCIQISCNPYMRQGELAHLRCFARDITEQKRARLVTAQLAAIVSSSADAILSLSPDGTVQTWNAAARDLFGYAPDEITGRSIKILFPKNRKHEIELMTDRARVEGRSVSETQLSRKDLNLMEVAVTLSPLRSGDGALAGFAATLRDISNRKRAERQRDLMLRELDHRISNLFSVVSAMIGLSARYAKSPQQLADSLRARIDALARSHQLIRGGAFESTVTVTQIVETALSPYVTVDEGRIAIEGTDLAIEPSAAVAFSMIMHELITNAVKYGALSGRSGRLAVNWSVVSKNAREFRLVWRESGFAAPKPEGGEGFGSVLLRQSARGMGGTFDVQFGQEGLTATMTVPLARILGEIAPRDE